MNKIIKGGFIMKTIDYYKKAIRQAENARESIEQINANYERECILTKNALESGILGQQGYKQQLAELEHDRDCQIEDALSRIDEVGAAYSAEMVELGKLDGSRIDDNVIKLLNSGIKLTTAEWQQLASIHKDNFLTTRLLKEKYNEAKSKENSKTNGFLMGQENDGLGYVKFGQSPQDRAENFNKFIRTIHNSCTYKSMPRYGGMDFASRQDYLNYLSKDSLERMQPFGEESFDNLDVDFPVNFVKSNPMIW